MIEYVGDDTVVIAFDASGKGTASTIGMAKKRGLKCLSSLVQSPDCAPSLSQYIMYISAAANILSTLSYRSKSGV